MMVEAGLAGASAGATSQGFRLLVEVRLRARLFVLGVGEFVSRWWFIILLMTVGRWCRWRGICRRRIGAVCGVWCRWVDALPVQYADYALWQREVLGSEDDPGVAFQPSGLLAAGVGGDSGGVGLPVDRPRRRWTGRSGREVAVRVDRACTLGWWRLARAVGRDFHGVAGGCGGVVSVVWVRVRIFRSGSGGGSYDERLTIWWVLRQHVGDPDGTGGESDVSGSRGSGAGGGSGCL